MIWNTIHGDERLRLWKSLRDDISEKSDIEKLEEVAKFCGSIPFGARTIDYYSSEDWPTPWEILYHSSFCTSSISLLMFYTLTMVDSDLNIELFLVEDDTGLYMLPVINNQYVLNYELGKVSSYSELQSDFTVLKKYTVETVKPIK